MLLVMPREAEVNSDGNPSPRGEINGEDVNESDNHCRLAALRAPPALYAVLILLLNPLGHGHRDPRTTILLQMIRMARGRSFDGSARRFVQGPLDKLGVLMAEPLLPRPYQRCLPLGILAISGDAN
jgi:hypothetical protein